MNKEILERYINGEASESERIQVSQWAQLDADNLKELIALRRLNDIVLWNNDDLMETKKKPNGFRKLLEELTKVAAVFLITLFTLHYWLPKSVPPTPEITMQSVFVPAGQRAELTLSDGTKVWLNAQTTLTYPSNFTSTSREVQLDGEAYFSVVANKEKPFRVKTARYDILALGTEFDVLAYSQSDYFETSLLSGVVQIESGNTRFTMQANTRLYTSKKGIQQMAIENYNYFQWKQGLIAFDDEAVANIMTKLELYYDVKIIVGNKNLLKRRYSGKFRTKDGIEHVLKVLQLHTRFRYEIDSEKNEIQIR